MEASSAHPVRILIVDDHPVMCSGLSNLLGMYEGILVIGSAGSGAEALMVIPRERPDLVLLDLRMPGIDGISVIQQLRKSPDSPKVIVLTSYAQDELIYQAIKAGAWGYLLKDTSAEEIIKAISSVQAGKHYIPVDISSRLAERMRRTDLTPRELQTLELLAEGHTNKEIATALKLSDYTVRHYVNNIMEKLHAPDRTGAVATAFRSGLLQRLDRS
jgi:DNA-binding NarL/FixJ family response regulator